MKSELEDYAKGGGATSLDGFASKGITSIRVVDSIFSKDKTFIVTLRVMMESITYPTLLDENIKENDITDL